MRRSRPDSRLPQRYEKSQNRGMRSDITSHTLQTYRTQPSADIQHPYRNIEWYKSSLVGVTNPFWRDEVRSGGDATTNANGVDFFWSNPFLTAQHGIHINPPYVNSFELQSSFSEVYGYPYISPPQSQLAPVDVQTDVEDRVRRKIVEQIKSIQSSVELGQDIGELKQTIEGVIHPMRSLKEHILGYFSSLRKAKARYRKPASLRKALSDSYLEFNFGWRPLAADIADALVGLQNRQHADRYPVKASAKQLFAGAISNDSLAAASVGQEANLVATAPTRTTSVYSIRYKGMVRSFAVNGRFSAAQTLQLDLPNFVPTVWDLIPYSFVVDYFANIGDIISAWSLRDGSVVYLVRTVHYIHRRETNVVLAATDLAGNPIYADNPDFFFSGHNAWVERHEWSRSKITQGSLVPPFRFSVPVSDKPWVNLGALISSNVSSLVPFHR